MHVPFYHSKSVLKFEVDLNLWNKNIILENVLSQCNIASPIKHPARDHRTES